VAEHVEAGGQGDSMILENYITENKDLFINRVNEISTILGINPDWLMLDMYHESGLDSSAVNPNGGATGLIQFMPATAAGLGTSTDDLLNMSNVDQLDYVLAYFKPYAGRIKTAYDIFLIDFFPAALGKPDDYIFHTSNLSAQTIANANKIFDLDGDGQITMAEYKQNLNNYFSKYGLDPSKKKI